MPSASVKIATAATLGCFHKSRTASRETTHIVSSPGKLRTSRSASLTWKSPPKALERSTPRFLAIHAARLHLRGGEFQMRRDLIIEFAVQRLPLEGVVQTGEQRSHDSPLTNRATIAVA